MNKQITLEEINDAKAYPAKVYRKTISESAMIEAMRKLAAAEMKANKMKPGGVPRTNHSEAIVGPQREAQLLEVIEATPDLTYRQMAEISGLSLSAVRNYLHPMVAKGMAHCTHKGRGTYRAGPKPEAK